MIAIGARRARARGGRRSASPPGRSCPRRSAPGCTCRRSAPRNSFEHERRPATQHAPEALRRTRRRTSACTRSSVEADRRRRPRPASARSARRCRARASACHHLARRNRPRIAARAAIVARCPSLVAMHELVVDEVEGHLERAARRTGSATVVSPRAVTYSGDLPPVVRRAARAPGGPCRRSASTCGASRRCRPRRPAAGPARSRRSAWRDCNGTGPAGSSRFPLLNTVLEDAHACRLHRVAPADRAGAVGVAAGRPFTGTHGDGGHRTRVRAGSGRPGGVRAAFLDYFADDAVDFAGAPGRAKDAIEKSRPPRRRSWN